MVVIVVYPFFNIFLLFCNGVILRIQGRNEMIIIFNFFQLRRYLNTNAIQTSLFTNIAINNNVTTICFTYGVSFNQIVNIPILGA
jgi:hypothetical protein